MNKNVINILEKFIKRSTLFKYGFNFNPAYRKSTGLVYFVSNDLLTIKIKIPLSYKNSNYVGTMFGGAMSSATDPIYMIQLIQILGDDYVVWDKSASIQFKRPGNKTLFANFIITNKFLNQIKNDIKQYNEKDYSLKVNLTDRDGKTTYAEVERVIYIASKTHFKNKRKNSVSTNK